MKFRFTRVYKGFERLELEYRMDDPEMTQEVYQKGNYVITISGKNQSFVVDKKNRRDFFGIVNREKFKTIEESWNYMKCWMDRNALRAEIG